MCFFQLSFLLFLLFCSSQFYDYLKILTTLNIFKNHPNASAEVENKVEGRTITKHQWDLKNNDKNYCDFSETHFPEKFFYHPLLLMSLLDVEIHTHGVIQDTFLKPLMFTWSLRDTKGSRLENKDFITPQFGSSNGWCLCSDQITFLITTI